MNKFANTTIGSLLTSGVSSLNKLPRLFLILPLLVFFVGANSAYGQEAAVPVEQGAIDSGDTAWMLTSSLLVLLMCLPGLTLFYGGLVRGKNILSLFVQCFALAGVMSLIWVCFGYAIAAGNPVTEAGLFGWDSNKLFLDHITSQFSGQGDAMSGGSIPESIFVMFQMTFIIISPAIVVGAVAERMKFSAVMLFATIWTIFSYLPMWHMAWGGGLFHHWGAIDFAGGNVVHINAGIAGLVACIVVGKRKGFPGPTLIPHNVPFVMIGAALLWVGWFGFNAGSAGGANFDSGLAMLVTQVAAAAAIVSWVVIEYIFVKKVTAVGIATGAVAGLVAITPAAGSTDVVGALFIGAISGVVCFFAATKLKNALGYDDSLDVFGVHGIGGIVGALLTGLFIRDGYTVGDVAVSGGMAQLWIQAKSVIVTIVWSGVVSVIAIYITKVICRGLRVDEDVEHAGLDRSEHGEEAYSSEG